ncbi:acetyltransferase [uncultured Corynebacterium sp.]|uniref:acetyltransferase n=1 Tax=uncultured Corynebacterium sp. TaxID=159447 RepID=UPI0025D01B21|nr:acetyltransferase [uncultured Corynebacterium sp.]
MDRELEKELWLSRVRVEWGQCGFSMSETAAADAVATLLFAPPRFVPTSRIIPTGPISPDAVMLTSLHIDPVIAGRGVEESLIAAVLKNLAERGVRAVEAFGCSGSGDDETGAVPPAEMTLTESILHAVDAPRLPHRCESGALGAVNHEAGDIIPTRMLINSGFTVVAPHPTHPRLRRELDPSLDWAAAVTDALDQLVAEQFYASLSASRSSTKL